MTENLFAILGIEALAGALGVELRAPLVTSPALRGAIAALRAIVPTLEEDRYMATDIAAATALVSDGRLAAAVSPAILPDLR